MRQPTLFLTVGLPATGKTTAARRLEVDRHALRLTKDEWMKAEMPYFEVSAVEQRRRLDQRLSVEPHTTWHISDQELVGWAEKMQVPTPGEVDGSEAIDTPPAGFASWDEWRCDRWPPAIV